MRNFFENGGNFAITIVLVILILVGGFVNYDNRLFDYMKTCLNKGGEYKEIATTVNGVNYKYDTCKFK